MTLNNDGVKLSASVLKAKALGFIKAIDKLSAAERRGVPSQSFGEDYNAMRELVPVSFPDLAPVLPPSAAIERGREYGGPFTQTPYGEILVYAEQIYQLLDTTG